jgi:hypothetical protein
MKINQSMKPSMSLAAAMGTLALAATSANAAVIIPVSATASSEFNGNASASNLLGAGFTALDPIESSTHGNGSWGSSTHWFSTGADKATPTVDFDLGGTFTVGTAHIWNWNGGESGWGVKDFTLIFSQDATFGNGDDTSQTFTGMPEASMAADYTGEHFTLTPAAGVTNIRLQVDTPYGGSFTGLSEVRFSEAVPEPSTTALLGLGGLALILRRRK